MGELLFNREKAKEIIKSINKEIQAIQESLKQDNLTVYEEIFAKATLEFCKEILDVFVESLEIKPDKKKMMTSMIKSKSSLAIFAASYKSTEFCDSIRNDMKTIMQEVEKAKPVRN
jgi:hypothetical protein